MAACKFVELIRIELTTFPLAAGRSYLLSYSFCLSIL
jgi:hypothetical protein